MASGKDSGSRSATNATARLSAVLDKLNANGTAASVADVLVIVFNIKDSDPNRSFLLAFTAMTRMLESSQREVETYLKDELNFYGPHFGPLRACFNPKNSASAWNVYKTKLSANEITGIRHTAQRLKKLVPEQEATDEDFADVLSAVEQMSQALDSEALSKHSRDTLRDCLSGIKRAIDEYKVWGAAGLNQAYKEFAGTLVTDPVLKADLNKDKEAGGSVWSNVKDVAKGLAIVLSIMHGIHDAKHDYLPAFEHHVLPLIEQVAPIIEGKPK